MRRREAISRTASPSSASAWAARTRPTCEARLTAIRNGSLFSSASSHASRTAARSRAPHASVTAQVAASRPGAASCSTSRRPTGSPSAHAASLPTSEASATGSSPTISTSVARRLAVRVHPRLLELCGDPADELPAARNVVAKNLALARGELLERRVLPQIVRDEYEHGAGRRVVEVGAKSVDVRLAPALDGVDDHGSTARIAEQAEGVGGGHDVCAGRGIAGQELDRVRSESIPESLEGDAPLRAVAAGEQVHRQKRLGRHRAKDSQRPACTEIPRPSDSTTTGPSRSVR